MIDDNVPENLGPYVKVTLGYDHKYRVVYATSMHKTATGKYVITGWDPDVNEGQGGYRSFRTDKVQGDIHLVNPPKS